MASDELFSSQTYFGLPNNKYGLVDKQDTAVGLIEKNIETDAPEVTVRTHIVQFDTRDCIGQLSLREAQRAFAFQMASDGKIPPERFKRALNNAGLLDINRLVGVVQDLQDEGIISGMPTYNSMKQSYVEGNQVKYKLQTPLKLISMIDVINVIIPRDIIPIYVYFPGFINNCLPAVPNTTNYLNPNPNLPNSSWVSPIPESVDDFIDNSLRQNNLTSNRLGGLYETPIRYWRSYTGPNCMPNAHTPPPYQLWNPPQDNLGMDPWPFQPTPVPGQRIPTYRARNGVIFAGYGLYDLDDFPVSQEIQTSDGTTIQVPLRKLMLKLLVPQGQYINGVDVNEVIESSIVEDFGPNGIVENPYTQTGYGDYQRFIPGPGIGMNYQPNQWRVNKSAPIDLGLSTYDPDTSILGPMPTPFPNFRGNVWGPYGRPGDRFQNVGLQATVDELYLNGDLDNLEGNPIIHPDYDPTLSPYTFELYVSTLRRSNSVVRFRNFETCTNPNIRNAMRVQFTGGFGAVQARIGRNTLTRGKPGVLEIKGLPNTQYDGAIHPFNSEVWLEPRVDTPKDWLETLSGPQKPTITMNSTSGFEGWMYQWRDSFPFTGKVYVPVTAGGMGPMEYFDSESGTWQLSDSNTSTSLTTGSEQWANGPVIGQTNQYIIPSSNPDNAEIASNTGWGRVLEVRLLTGGQYYYQQEAVRTTYLSGSNTGSGLTINVLDIGYLNNPDISITDQVTRISIHTGGNGYRVGDILIIAQARVPFASSAATYNATIEVVSATELSESIIPEHNLFHYHDPLAVGPSGPADFAALQPKYTDGADECTEDCPETNCTPPGGLYKFCTGSIITSTGTAKDDPRVPPNPPCLLKCDFIDIPSPESVWNADLSTGNVTQRPLDNARILQQANYINRRIAYSDQGPNNGFFITALAQYRQFFVSSIPGTDLVIRIKQAERTVFNQSINPTVDGSNFHIPIRPDLIISTSGTPAYVEAVQSTLTTTGVYWVKNFYPPRAELVELTLEFFTYDGTPIPLERSLGFVEQFKTQGLLYSSSISSSYIFHGSYNTFAPNVPPFPSNLSSVPSSVLLSTTSNSKTLEFPFDPRLIRYTQRNISIMFRVNVYQALNPGITHIIKKMPDAYAAQQVETFEDEDGNTVELTPLASNAEYY